MKNLIFSLILLASLQLQAQQILEILPLTESILMVHIDEGFIDFHGNGEPTSSDQVIGAALNENAASILANYDITSSGDANYTTAKNPVNLSRKSKGTAFANFCDSWEYLPFFDDVGCQNDGLDHLKEHWIYLTLPTPMVSGETYIINALEGIVEGNSAFFIVFEEQNIRSEAVHVNNLGYSVEAAEKFGYIYHWMGDGGSLDLNNLAGNTFGLYNLQTETIDFTGNLTFRKDKNNVETFQNNPAETPNQNFLQADVYECDFSDFNEVGTYRLYIEGIGASYDFEISCNALRPAFQTVMKGLFQNRSGIELSAEHTDFPRPVDHNPILTPNFAGQLKYTSTTICEVSDPDASQDDKALWEAGIQGDLEAWGWYQDAGDWDAYPTHLDVPTKLLFTYEHFAENFTDGDLNLPESGNGLPDILDEARWLLRFYKRLKDETENKGWTTGGVPGSRIFGDLWGDDLGEDGLGRGSWQDTDRQWVVSGEDPVVSFHYAALAAHFAYLLNRDGLTDAENIDWLAEAETAFIWANDNYNPNFQCHDNDVRWLKNYAAVALFRLTENADYHSEFLASWTDTGIQAGDELTEQKAYGTYIYATLNNADAAVQQLGKDLVEATADFQLLTNEDQRACRWGGNIFFPMLVGQGTTPFVYEGLMGYAILKNENPTKAAQYWKNLHLTADYFLGNNPLNMTWITGLGEKSPSGVLHLDSWYDDNEGTVAGIVPYGPWLQQQYYFGYGAFNNLWANKTVYPEIDVWPGHERWFEQRYAPLVGEFTVHQNGVNAAAIYGALSGEAGCTDVVATVNIPTARTVEIEVFPNPSDAVFYLKNKSKNAIERVTLHSIDGRILKVQNADFEQINVAGLNAGIYFLEIIGDVFKEVKKVIIE